MVRTTISEVLKKRFRSGLEEALAIQISAADLPVNYETTTVQYEWPARQSRYTVDFDIPGPDGQTIFIEAKGIFDVQSRQKMLLVKAQNPSMDIRFIFSNSRAPLYKGSKTTYGDWATKHGFLWADREIPDDWLNPKIGEDDVPEQTDLGSPDEGGVDQLS